MRALDWTAIAQLPHSHIRTTQTAAASTGCNSQHTPQRSHHNKYSHYLYMYIYRLCFVCSLVPLRTIAEILSHRFSSAAVPARLKRDVRLNRCRFIVCADTTVWLTGLRMLSRTDRASTLAALQYTYICIFSAIRASTIVRRAYVCLSSTRMRLWFWLRFWPVADCHRLMPRFCLRASVFVRSS